MKPDTPYLVPVAGLNLGWTLLLIQLERMVSAANQSGLRHPARRGRGYQWVVYPREYLQLTQQLGRAPAAVRARVTEICA